MELRHLRYFIAVAEDRSFTRAAERLRISQPPLSIAIRQLEEELGVVLFVRARHRVSMTPAGELFLREARMTLEQAERAVRVARNAGAATAGTIRIGFSPSADLTVLPAIARRLRDRCPGLELCLRAMTATEQLAGLRERTLDAAIVRLPLDREDAAALHLERMFEEPLCIAVELSHPFAKRARVPLASLAKDPLILFARAVAPGAYDLLLARCRDAGFTPRIAYETESLQTALGLVAGGLGIAFVPEAATALGRAGVAIKRLEAPEPMLQMGVVCRREDPSPTMKAFAEAVDAVRLECDARPKRNKRGAS